MRKVLAYVAAVLLLVPRSAPAQSGPAAGDRTVTILHFNDVYEITPVDGGKHGGLARVAAFRARLKGRHPGLVTTLGGDYLSPSALGMARVNGERLNGRQMVAVLNLLGLDWATFGNHEFDIPEPAFRTRLAESTFHIVSSNVTDAAGAPFPGVVQDAVVRVKTPGGESVPEIDLILGGHEHENWAIQRGPRLTPIVKADANVRTLAVVTIRVPRPARRTGAAAPAPARPVITTYLERIDETMKEGPRTSAEVRRWRDMAFAAFRNDGFDPAEVVSVIPQPLEARESIIRNGPTRMTALILDAMVKEAGTSIAIFNSGSIRLDDELQAGPVTQYDVIRVLPFGGKILRATFTGALLSRVLQIGEQNKGTGGYLQTAGVPLVIDPGARYTLALPEFLLTGGEANLEFLTRDNPAISDIASLRDIRLSVIDELKRGPLGAVPK
jgi:5'-nucleotidase